MRLPLIILLLAGCAPSATGEPTPAARGMAAHVDVEYPARLQARPDQSPTSPFMVRVSTTAGGARQRIEFVGTVAGEFDLREYIGREDGKALTDLPELLVHVGSHLPPDWGTDLYSSGHAGLGWRAHYREVLWGALALWAAVPAGYLIWRTLRKPPAADPVAPEPPPMTVEEQLLAVIRSASSHALSVDERGQLELLVFRYFGQHLGTSSAYTSDPAQTLRDVRQHPEARELVASIENWLHARGGTQNGHTTAGAALEEFRRSRVAAGPRPDEDRIPWAEGRS